MLSKVLGVLCEFCMQAMCDVYGQDRKYCCFIMQFYTQAVCTVHQAENWLLVIT